MEKFSRVKNKYIFYNDDKEILVLYNGRKTIYIPGLIEQQQSDSFSEGIKYIIDILSSKSEIVYLDSFEKEFPILGCQNTKMKKVIMNETKNYFSCYCKFSKEFCEKAMQLYYSEGIEFNLINIDEFKKIIQNKQHLKIDEFLLKSIEELEKRLAFKKY